MSTFVVVLNWVLDEMTQLLFSTSELEEIQKLMTFFLNEYKIYISNSGKGPMHDYNLLFLQWFTMWESCIRLRSFAKYMHLATESAKSSAGDGSELLCFRSCGSTMEMMKEFFFTSTLPWPRKRGSTEVLPAHDLADCVCMHNSQN